MNEVLMYIVKDNVRNVKKWVGITAKVAVGTLIACYIFKKKINGIENDLRYLQEKG